MPGFEVRRGLLFACPLEHVLRGYWFESSAFSRADFCIYVFAQALFVPKGHLVFSLGDRLGSIRGRQDKWWTYTEGREKRMMADILAHMQREGPIVLDKFKTLKDFVRNAINTRTNPYSPYPPEMVAYGAVLTGDARKAQEMFDRLERTLRDAREHRDYYDEILSRARRVRETFERDPAEAVAILNRWREETAANLKLTEFLERTEPSASKA